MICDNWDKLSHAEKITLIGECVHILQSSNKYFNILTNAVNEAHREGVLEGIVLLPPDEFRTNEIVEYLIWGPSDGASSPAVACRSEIKSVDNVSKTALIEYEDPYKGGAKSTVIVSFNEITKVKIPSKNENSEPTNY